MLEESPAQLFIPVEQKFVGTKFFTASHKNDMGLTPVERISLLGKKHKSEVEQAALPMSEQLREATRLASQEIAQLCAEVGIATPDLKVIYLSDEDYKRFFPESETLGLHFGLSGLSVVKNDGTLPNHVLASITFHEWIHSVFDQKISVYNAQRNEWGNTDEYPERIYQSLRRSGLETRPVDYQTRSSRIRGEVLNELGNYIVQARFIKKLLSNDTLFGDELEQRRSVLKTLDDNPEKISCVGVTVEANYRRYAFTLDQDKLLITNTGELIASTNASKLILNLQFADDIARLVKTVDGDPLYLAFLKAKLDPRRIHKLRRAIDTSMGYDFSKKLMAETDKVPANIVPLIPEVQSQILKQTRN